MADYIGQPSPRRIIDLYNDITNGTTKLQPDFQRKLVWSDKHKEAFLDTILNKYPFPEIYIADGDMNLQAKTTEKWVVDGQQRLGTIMQYIDGGNIKLSKVPIFADLDEETQKAFFNYSVVVRDLGNLEVNNIKEIFKRINSVNYALNSIEIKNALYDGEYISTADVILSENTNFFENFGIFSNNEKLRMKDLEFILTLMSTIENKGYFSNTKENDKYIQSFNEEYINSDYIRTQFKDVFDFISNMNLDPYSIWFKKSNIFTLIIEIFWLYSDKTISLDIFTTKNILDKFEIEMLKRKNSNQDEDEFARYYINSLQGTGSKSARVIRGSILNDFIVKNLS